MKIFKEDQHSFFPRPLQIGRKTYLSVAVLVFVDLTAPGVLLPEQELWKALPEQLGPTDVIDQGVPKPRGEFLVTGSCFAPRGERRSASQVRVRVGEREKKLNVYGDRFWDIGTITEAREFSEMPLDWGHAFGGPQFKANPLGKGIDPTPMPDGSSAIPLPNVESPTQPIGSPMDRPDPAGLGPLDMMWPQRFDKNGTYDDVWMAKHWPYFPDDMNYEYFNQSCEDQYLDEFFQGGEQVVIERMHPDVRRIETTLPKLRMRVFLSQNPDYKPYTFPVGPLPSFQVADNETFREVSTRLETAWFFPSILRGVLIYRGMTEIIDEEHADVLRVLIRHEHQDELRRPLEHYRDLQISLLDRGVDLDMGPLNEALQEGRKLQVTVKNIPKMVDDIRQNALGQKPTMPMSSPAEMMETAQKQMAAGLAQIDSMEAMAQEFHAQFGHLADIDLTLFDKQRSMLARMQASLQKGAGQLAAEQKDMADSQAAVLKEMSGKLSDLKANLAESDVDIDVDNEISAVDDFQSDDPVNPWHDRGFPLVVHWRKTLANDDRLLARLRKLGIQSAPLTRHWVGYSRGPYTDTPDVWGLDGNEPFTLPPGLIIPRFDGPVLTGITGMAGDLGQEGRTMVPGSDQTPLFLPAATLIDLPSLPAAAGAPVICVADELQALFMEQEVGDCCSILVMGTPDAAPGEDAANALDEAQVVLVVMSAEWETRSDLKEVWSAWQQALAGATPMELEAGTTVFQAHAEGHDIRQWVFDHLPAAYAKDNVVGGTPAENDQPPGELFSASSIKFPDLGAIISGVFAQVQETLEGDVAPLLAKQETLLETVQDKTAGLADHGIDLSKPDLDAARAGKSISPREATAKMAKMLRNQADQLEKAGDFPADALEKMRAAADKAETQGDWAETFAQDKEAKLEALQAEMDAGLQQIENKELPGGPLEMEIMGVDAQAFRALTREEVQRMHDRGERLAGAVLSGVDLSDMDLTGADFTACRMEETDFSRTRLDGALFDKVTSEAALFIEASLHETTISMSRFSKADFSGADLTHARIVMSQFAQCGFKGAVLAGADLSRVVIEESDFTNADMVRATLSMSSFSGMADNADLRESRFYKILWQEMTLNEANFRNAAINSSLFEGVKGEMVDFTDANLDLFNTAGNTEFRHARFVRSSLRQSGLRETDFTGSDFREAHFDGAVVEDSVLRDVEFNRTRGRNTRFTKCDFGSACLRAADLGMCGLRKSRLVNTDLRGANLFSVDFYKAVLGHTRFEGANLKRTFLENVDPQEDRQ